MEFFTSLMNVDEIKKAYRKLAMKWHPDRNNGSNESTEMMKRINNAYHAALKGFHGKTYRPENSTPDQKEWTYYYNQKKEQSVIDKLNELIAHDLSEDAEIWLVGFWIWVVNTNREHDKKFMNESKMRWHTKRNAWYWKPAGKRRSRYNKRESLSGLAAKYGVEIHTPDSDKETKRERVAIAA
jgi:hypothetical protein